jgi:hypothetical protein
MEVAVDLTASIMPPLKANQNPQPIRIRGAFYPHLASDCWTIRTVTETKVKR